MSAGWSFEVILEGTVGGEEWGEDKEEDLGDSLVTFKELGSDTMKAEYLPCLSH